MTESQYGAPFGARPLGRGMCPPVSTRRFASHARATPRTTIVSETAPEGTGAFELEGRAFFCLRVFVFVSSFATGLSGFGFGFLSTFPRPRAA